MILYMTYTARISSKGQITLPVEVRRGLQLSKKVNIDIDIKGGKATLVKPPTMADAWAILDAPSKPEKLSKREQMLADHFAEEDRRIRGY